MWSMSPAFPFYNYRVYNSENSLQNNRIYVYLLNSNQVTMQERNMEKPSANTYLIFYISIMVIILTGCSKDNWDIKEQGIPKFVETNYIELDKIQQISRFRSSEGHDYSDSFEHCRSMKHYFQPKYNIDWSTVKIYSPVSGTIKKVYEEWAGTQLEISSDAYPAFRFIIFHLKLSIQFNVGDKVTSGDQIGTHIGSQTMSDIAVSVNEAGNKRRLISYFEVIADDLFIEFASRGVNNRKDVIISQSERDSDPISCNGETFITSGTLENWFVLN